MNGAHLHLLFNHIPITGIAIGFLLLLFAIVRGSDVLKRGALVILVAAALLTIPLYLSGEPAEEVVERLPGVSKQLIEAHESAAKIALALSELTGIAALIGLVISRGSKVVAKPLALVALLLALGTSGVVAWTANLGGQIRHTEIRSAGSVTPQQQDRRGEESEHKEGHKED